VTHRRRGREIGRPPLVVDWSDLTGTTKAVREVGWRVFARATHTLQEQVVLIQGCRPLKQRSQIIGFYAPVRRFGLVEGPGYPPGPLR
jgi:hypothetical protein